MPVKITKIQQKYFDAARLDALQKTMEGSLPLDSGLRLDVMIALTLLKDCFKYGFIERVDE